MAASTKPKLPLPEELLAELSEIAAQVEAPKSATREQAQFAKTLSSFSNRITRDDAMEMLEAVEVDAALVEQIAETMSAWADELSPTAEVRWHREEVNAKVGLLENMANLGFLSDAQAQQLHELRPSLTKRATGDRQPQKAIEGRPERVRLVDLSNGETISTQRGNTSTSANNLRAQAMRFVKRTRNVEPTTETRDLFLKAANKVCKGESISEEAVGFRIEVAA